MLRERLGKLNRIQHGRAFKVIASVVIVLACIGAFGTYFVIVTSPGAEATPGQIQAQPQQPEVSPQTRSALDASARAIQDVLAARTSPVGFAMGVGAAGAVALTIVWLGLGLTYLGLLAVAAGMAAPLSLVGPTQGLARILVGVVALTASFSALMELARVLLSGPGPIFAVARNVLAEAVRMKVSLVFIVMLILGLAALPGWLDAHSPLRYRVQSFLQFGTGGAFWIIAMMTLFFAAASVSFEQRDRIIWQTMTKPVSAWQYVLGKWLGVIVLDAALLVVAASGVFLFVEYLRQQPALGEQEAYVSAANEPISQDRLILETQVLAGRRSVEADALDLDPNLFEQAVDERIKTEKTRNPLFDDSPPQRRKLHDDLYKSLQQQYRSIEPGRWEIFRFSGLGSAHRRSVPLTLRYRIDAGSNRPDVIYKVSFSIAGRPPIVRETALGPNHSVTIAPFIIAPGGEVILMDDPRFQLMARYGLERGATYVSSKDLVDPDGVLAIQAINGQALLDAGGTPRGIAPNAETMTFPPGGLEISYEAGSYRANFMRVIAVLWVKLGFLAMVAIAAATFLNFPTACLVAFGIFFMAEGANFLADSLKYWTDSGPGTTYDWWEYFIMGVGGTISKVFSVYANLKPTTRLVDGRLLSWADASRGTLALLSLTGLLYGVGVSIFRKRELAIYSGH